MLTCALRVGNTGNVGLTLFKLLSGAVNCTSSDPVTSLAPKQSTVCIIQTAVADISVVETGGSVLLDYSNYAVSAGGKVSAVAVNAPLTDSVALSGVAGWTAPAYHAVMDLAIDPATCTVPAQAGTQDE
jgi:hypothetical protein